MFARSARAMPLAAARGGVVGAARASTVSRCGAEAVRVSRVNAGAIAHRRGTAPHTPCDWRARAQLAGSLRSGSTATGPTVTTVTCDATRVSVAWPTTLRSPHGMPQSAAFSTDSSAPGARDTDGDTATAFVAMDANYMAERVLGRWVQCMRNRPVAHPPSVRTIDMTACALYIEQQATAALGRPVRIARALAFACGQFSRLKRRVRMAPPRPQPFTFLNVLREANFEVLCFPHADLLVGALPAALTAELLHEATRSEDDKDACDVVMAVVGTPTFVPALARAASKGRRVCVVCMEEDWLALAGALPEEQTSRIVPILLDPLMPDKLAPAYTDFCAAAMPVEELETVLWEATKARGVTEGSPATMTQLWDVLRDMRLADTLRRLETRLRVLLADSKLFKPVGEARNEGVAALWAPRDESEVDTVSAAAAAGDDDGDDGTSAAAARDESDSDSGAGSGTGYESSSEDGDGGEEASASDSAGDDASSSSSSTSDGDDSGSGGEAEPPEAVVRRLVGAGASKGLLPDARTKIANLQALLDLVPGAERGVDYGTRKDRLPALRALVAEHAEAIDAVISG